MIRNPSAPKKDIIRKLNESTLKKKKIADTMSYIYLVVYR